MVDLEELSKVLEKEAFETYEETIDKTQIERPDDNDLFKDNAETQKICQQVIDHDEQIRKVLEAQRENAYTVREEERPSSRRDRVETVKAEPVRSGWGSGFYGSSSSSTSGSSDRSYGYSSSYGRSTAKTKEELEKEKQEKFKQEIDEVFKTAVEDAFDTSGVDNKNIFELEEAEQRKRRIRTQQAKNNGAYTPEQKQLKKKLKKMIYALRAYSAVKVALRKNK